MPADYVEEVLRLARTLRSAGVEYMMTGAAALAIYGTPRTSLDVDVSVLAARDEVLRALRHAGYRTTPQAGPESHLLTAASPDGFRVDIWFTPDIAWDKGGYQRKRVTEIRGEKVNFVSPEELIARKLWRYRKEANHQDLEDVRVILAGSAKLDLEFLEVSLGAMRTWGLFQELLSEAEKSKQPGADGNPVTNS